MDGFGAAEVPVAFSLKQALQLVRLSRGLIDISFACLCPVFRQRSNGGYSKEEVFLCAKKIKPRYSRGQCFLLF
jgi:hypothetical protein